MPSQRTALAILIFAECAAFAYMSETVIFPTVIAILVLIGLGGRWRYRMSQDRQVILSLIAALVFVVQWRVQPHSLPDDSMVYLSPFLHSLGQFLLVLQTAALYLHWEDDLLPVALPWPGVFVMVSAGDIYARASQRFIFQLCALAFAAATALYFLATARAAARSEHQPYGAGKALLAIVLLAGMAGFASLASTGLQRYERTLDRLVSELLNPAVTPSSAGFPSRSRLGSIAERKGTHSQDVALRVDAPQEPGYLRGLAYHWITTVPRFRGADTTQWEQSPPSRFDQGANAPGEILRPSDTEGIRYRYELKPPERTLSGPLAVKGAPGEMEVWLEPAHWGTYFLPPHCEEIVTFEDELRRDCRQVISGTDGSVVHYLARTGRRPDRELFFDLESDEGHYSRAALLQYPARFAEDPQIRGIVDRVFARSESITEHVDAVEDYFQTNYGYAIGIEIPQSEDPIHWFLRQRPNAHCEYFAQGAALLLRMKGIPTRYMTGFVVAEQNEYGGFWLARNEDAHAWCEAWDDERGWIIVEATPAAGIPAVASAPRHRQLWEYLSARLAEFRYSFAEGGWRWLLGRVLAFLATPAGWLCMGLLVAYVCIRLWMTHRPSSSPQVPPLIAELQRLLRRVDQRFERQGISRGAGETLTRFAHRIEQTTGDAGAARWYADYAGIRYGADVDKAAVEALKQRLTAIGPPSRGSRIAQRAPRSALSDPL